MGDINKDCATNAYSPLARTDFQDCATNAHSPLARTDFQDCQDQS